LLRLRLFALRAWTDWGRYEELGAEGFHSLYRWYQSFEAQHFPDPAGLREAITRYTLHIYPGVVKAAMALYDVPEAIAVTRTAMCANGVASLSRLQVWFRSHLSNLFKCAARLVHRLV
jgi:hypothetical protein